MARAEFAEWADYALELRSNAENGEVVFEELERGLVSKTQFATSCEFYQKSLTNYIRKCIMKQKKQICKEVLAIKISYKKLWILLIEKEISPATLRKDLNIATGTMTKMRKNEEVALSVLLRICEYLDCNIGDICDAVKIEDE